MRANSHYDAIVVGAGPAGGVAAYVLARSGCRVLLLEKEKLPRYKTCGGGVVRRAWEALPFPFSIESENHVVESRVSRFRVTLDLERPLVIERNPPVVVMTMRSTFDEHIVAKAVEAGAGLADGVSVENIEELRDAVHCRTSAGPFIASFLIGADGVNSAVRRSLGWRGPRCGVALEAEVYPREERLVADYAGRADFDFNVLPRGYGWVFPKADHLSAGVFTLRSALPEIRRTCEAYLERKGLAERRAESSTRGHRIPLGPATAKLNSRRVLLAGDAAGLADPLTGEGISYAIRSGRLAGECVAAALGSPANSLDTYSNALRADLGAEIRWASFLAKPICAFPALFYRVLTRKQVFAERACEVFEGKTTYGEQLRRLARHPHKLL